MAIIVGQMMDLFKRRYSIPPPAPIESVQPKTGGSFAAFSFFNELSRLFSYIFLNIFL